MDEPEVLLDIKGSVAILTLNRPKVLNALSRSLQLTLEKYILQLENDDKVNCIIITGTGEKAFSAGGDIHEMDTLSKMNNPSPDHPSAKWYTWRLMNCAKPLIGAINGLAFGGGALMASSFDIRIGTNNTSFKFLAATYGRLNSSWTLPAQIGWPKAKELLFTGRQVMAQEAVEIGLLNHLVPADKLMEKTLEIAEMISNNDPRMVQGLKRLVSENIGHTLKEQYNHEMRAVQDWLKPISVQDSFKTFLDKKGRK